MNTTTTLRKLAANTPLTTRLDTPKSLAMQTLATPRLSALAIAIALACASSAHAAPTGGEVKFGEASITTGNNTIIKQSSQKAIINWQNFSIAHNESVDFQQPNPQALTLNRVLGNEKSLIHGKLTANGRVFLVNTHGILIGSGATVDVGGLVASAHDIGDLEFLQGAEKTGEYVFKGAGAGEVHNHGNITAADRGFVALLGRDVRNNGVIIAEKGRVTLNGAEKITLRFEGDNLLAVTLEPGALAALVENGGAIHADGGRVILSADAAEAIVNAQVNNTGIVRARTLADLTGNIDIEGGAVALGGTLDVSAPQGGNGGTVAVRGENPRIANGLNLVAAATDKNASGTLSVQSTEDFRIGADGKLSAPTLGRLLDEADVRIASRGDVVLDEAMGWRAANGLALVAEKDIHINAPLAVNGAGRLELETKGDYYIRTPASYAGADVVPPQEGVAGAGLSTPREDTSGGVYGSITFSGEEGNALRINGEDYRLVYALEDIATTGTVDGVYYALARDIDAAEWSTTNTGVAGVIGTLQNSTFTGLGHVIDNLALSNDVYRGSLGFIVTGNQINIRDLGLTNAAMDGTPSLYMKIGILMGAVSGKTSHISNVYTTGSAIGNDSSPSGIGGLVGSVDTIAAHALYISNAFTDVTIARNSTGGIGGLVGDVSSTGAIILDHVHALGSLTNLQGNAGGLVGWINDVVLPKFEKDVLPSSITASYSAASVSGLTVGGLAGEMHGRVNGNARITDSFSIGPVMIAGDLSSAFTPVLGSLGIGGLVGKVSKVDASNVYATGGVQDNSTKSGRTAVFVFVGGLFGGLGKNSSIDHASVFGEDISVGNNILYVGGLVGAADEGTSITLSSAAAHAHGGSHSDPIGRSRGDIDEETRKNARPFDNPPKVDDLLRGEENMPWEITTNNSGKQVSTLLDAIEKQAAGFEHEQIPLGQLMSHLTHSADAAAPQSGTDTQDYEESVVVESLSTEDGHPAAGEKE
ncbi:MAG: filamentous hemagglutinin N-terminal domain-containing protein [Azoarcus sp.]|jgi:filamentous hemagglutinin family protein|nr:filamentous hemagglutinin N-terminal domain-containing protein [Azoarcus sp.]